MRTPEPVHFAEMRALPAYELRARPRGVDVAMQVRQLPAPATPHLHRPRIVGAAVAGRLDVLDAWADAELRRDRIDRPGPGASVRIPETTALRLALMFRAVAPLRRVRDAHQVIAGVAGMADEEAAYWLGMVIHRPRARRTLAALRLMLTDGGRHERP